MFSGKPYSVPLPGGNAFSALPCRSATFKGFIKADVYDYTDIDTFVSEATLREKGLIRSEGKEYMVKDGDVCHFKFNV